MSTARFNLDSSAVVTFEKISVSIFIVVFYWEKYGKEIGGSSTSYVQLQIYNVVFHNEIRVFILKKIKFLFTPIFKKLSFLGHSIFQTIFFFFAKKIHYTNQYFMIKCKDLPVQSF